MRRQFNLPMEEIEGFASLYPEWEALTESGKNWLLIRKFPVPAGYNVSTVELAVQIHPGYPREKLDMIYVYPVLSLTNGRTIPAVESREQIDQRAFQRWSRHYPWNPLQHNIAIHLQFAADWLERELARVAA
jgi:hypothetical protein